MAARDEGVGGLANPRDLGPRWPWSRSGDAATPPTPVYLAALNPDGDADAAGLPLAPTVASNALAIAISGFGVAAVCASASRSAVTLTGSG